MPWHNPWHSCLHHAAPARPRSPAPAGLEAASPGTPGSASAPRRACAGAWPPTPHQHPALPSLNTPQPVGHGHSPFGPKAKFTSLLFWGQKPELDPRPATALVEAHAQIQELREAGLGLGCKPRPEPGSQELVAPLPTQPWRHSKAAKSARPKCSQRRCLQQGLPEAGAAIRSVFGCSQLMGNSTVRKAIRPADAAPR